jgi:hypothetical protein
MAAAQAAWGYAPFMNDSRTSQLAVSMNERQAPAPDASYVARPAATARTGSAHRAAGA